MSQRNKTLFFAMVCLLGFAAVGVGQQPSSGTLQKDYQPPGYNTAESSDSQAALQARLRELEQKFDGWLSVQNIYTAAEVAAMKAKLQQQVQNMSAQELEDFISKMEARLTILLSEEAMDARHYLSFYTQEARRQRIAPTGKVPQVLEMPVAELRQELFDFQQERAQRAASQNAFSRAQGERALAITQQQQARQAQQLRSMNQARSQVASYQPPPPRQKPQPPASSHYAPRPLVTSQEFARQEVLRTFWAF